MIKCFSSQQITAEEWLPAAHKIVKGHPQQTAWNHYSDSTEQFHCGIWQGESGSWQVHYAAHEEEFCLLIEGEVRLTDSGGQVSKFVAGDAFVVPGGFQGTWENISRVKKYYAIMHLKA
jgi:uncharacterized cupin superfamily protein